MPNPNSATDLASILADLYPDPQSMGRVTHIVGIPITWIVLLSAERNDRSSAIHDWQAILSEADKTNKVDSLLNVILAEHKENFELRQAVDAYRTSSKQNNASDNISSPLTSSDTKTDRGSSVGSNVSTDGGDFIGRDKSTQGDEVKGNKVGRDSFNINAENVTIYQYPEGKAPSVANKPSDRNEDTGAGANPPIQPDSADKQIDIFLSYSRIDSEIMRRLRADLRNAGFTVWTDDVGLEPGTPSWQRAIEEAIQAARCVIVLLSPEAKKSKWVEIEVSLAEDLGLRIFPLLVRGNDRNAILFRLRTTQRIDVRDNWQAVKEQLIPALRRYLRPNSGKVDSKALPSGEKPRQGRYRWQWGVGIVTLLVLIVGITLWTMYHPISPSITPKATPTAGQAVALVDTPTPTALPTNSPMIALTATSVPPTATVLPTHTPLPPTATALPTDTPTSNLTLTAQAEATMRAASDLTLTALAPTVTSTSPPSPTNTPVPPTATSIATNTPILPTSTSLPTNTPSATVSPTDTAMPSATPTPAPSATWTNPKDDAVYVWIPADTFIIGSSAEDTLADNDEKPPHSVNVDGFWMMQKEVTNAQYARCVTAGFCRQPDNNRWNDAHYARRPVVNLNWYQAQGYAKWVGGRLPSEAEWEYACRGTDGRIYPWGNDPPSIRWLNYSESNKGDTMPVGSYPRGVNTLYDMAGNVSEWTSSLYKPYPYKADDGREDPKPKGVRTLRGGSFYQNGDVVRCAARNYYDPYYRFNDVGFRVVLPGF